MTGIASGTKITMIDGNDKAIEEVAVGDDVLAYDFDNKRVMFGKVTKIKTSSGPATEIVTSHAKVVSSLDQLFFISENADTKSAKELHVGDEILWFDMFHGRREKIIEKRHVTNSVFYDFVVSDYENFMANAIIVAGK